MRSTACEAYKFSWQTLSHSPTAFSNVTGVKFEMSGILSSISHSPTVFSHTVMLRAITLKIQSCFFYSPTAFFSNC